MNELVNEEMDDIINYFNSLPKHDPNRTKRILTKLLKLWNKCSDVRLNQLIITINQYNNPELIDAFYLEDDEFESNLDNMLADNEK